MRPLLPALALLAIVPSPARSQVFADVETKRSGAPFGNFTIQLDHDFAPFTVANFIRLAEGLVSWIDPESGELRSGPFYDGLEFYAVTAGFEVACGSPSNDEAGGPGYVFQDDFRSGIPDQFAVFMDNDGPNTNGSRFFINLGVTLNPALRPGQYSRFGQVLQLAYPPGTGNGRATVAAISQSAPGFVTIEKVTMRYVGTAAQNFRLAVEDQFHPYLSNLPDSRVATFTFRRSPGSLILDWDSAPGSIAQFWTSPDLQAWFGPSLVRNIPGEPSFGLDLTPTLEFSPTAFFRGGVTTYPEWPSTERPLAGSLIQTGFFDPMFGNFTSTYAFDQNGTGGTYSSAFGSGSFEVTSTETSDPYTTRLELTPTSGGQPTYRLTLHHDLDWSSPIPSIALPLARNPSRLEGENLANPGVPLQGGQWTYTGAP